MECGEGCLRICPKDALSNLRFGFISSWFQLRMTTKQAGLGMHFSSPSLVSVCDWQCGRGFLCMKPSRIVTANFVFPDFIQRINIYFLINFDLRICLSLNLWYWKFLCLSLTFGSVTMVELKRSLITCWNTSFYSFLSRIMDKYCDIKKNNAEQIMRNKNYAIYKLQRIKRLFITILFVLTKNFSKNKLKAKWRSYPRESLLESSN